jgi:hypothetical protein
MSAQEKLKALARKLNKLNRESSLAISRSDKPLAPQPPPAKPPAPLGAPNNANDPTSKRMG